VTGLIFRKFAASSGVTKGSLSSAGFIFLLRPGSSDGPILLRASDPSDVGRLTGEQTLLLTLTHVYQYSQYVTLRKLVRLTQWQTRPQCCSSR
jgi:hypothetical protein